MVFSSRVIVSAVGALVVVVVVVAGGARACARTSDPSDGRALTRTAAAGAGEDLGSVPFSGEAAMPVEGVRVLRDTLVLTVGASGQAAAWKRAAVLAEIGGRLTAVPVQDGDRVAVGGLLAVSDTADLWLAVADADAARREAEARYREQLLFDDSLMPAVRRERALAARLRSGLDRAEIRLRKVRLDLERARARAPFSGRVASVRVVSGEQVSAGAELMTVVAADPILVHVDVLEGELAHLVPGGRAEIQFAAFPDETYTGTIRSINPVVDERTRMARVTVVASNADGSILPGMYARVELESERLPDRVLIPRSAILERDRRTLVFVYENGRAKWRFITIGREGTDLVELVPGRGTEVVEPGEVVLTAGHFTLTHNAAVRLVNHLDDAPEGRPR